MKTRIKARAHLVVRVSTSRKFNAWKLGPIRHGSLGGNQPLGVIALPHVPSTRFNLAFIIAGPAAGNKQKINESSPATMALAANYDEEGTTAIPRWSHPEQ